MHQLVRSGAPAAYRQPAADGGFSVGVVVLHVAALFRLTSTCHLYGQFTDGSGRWLKLVLYLKVLQRPAAFMSPRVPNLLYLGRSPSRYSCVSYE